MMLTEIREVFDYADGVLYWKKPYGNSKEGDIAGYLGDDGYWKVKVDEREYFRSRLVWAYHKGSWPVPTVDHRNQKRLEDNIENLRQATHSQQNQNQKARPNKTGYRGVVKQTKGPGYEARIWVNKKKIHLGSYPTAKEAHAVYTIAAKHYFGEFYCDS